MPAPNTQREVAATLEAARIVTPGARVAVVEHGAPATVLHAEIARLGGVVTSVPVYRWELVDDTSALAVALARLASGIARVAAFTSAAQVDLALAFAAERGLEDAVRATLRAGVVASIGPVCSARLRSEALEPDVEPEHSKMGHLVKALAERARGVLEAKARGA